ncbi:MAG: hypothetical protein ACR5KV_03600 [Wolbachia sp.]
MNCDDLDCLKFNFSASDAIYNNRVFMCHLRNSVEFKLKCEGENVIYKESKVSLTIPKELKNYRVGDKNLFNVIIEYFQNFYEKFGFQFKTKVKHSLDEPLKVLSDVNATQDKLNKSK